MKLSGLVSVGGGKWIESAEIEFNDPVDESFPSPKVQYWPAAAPHIQAIVASIGVAAGDDLGSPATVLAACAAWVYQDDDAHETCSLTACLNPLHPGPCKGWKGNLFKVAPNAYHALESARVEKANAARLKKIQALKDAGKPIPKKLLTPIVAKPHPHAGQTANAATGEAHHAGQAVSDAAGVHAQHPGKVTLGQAVKQIKATDATSEKGAKGKKPTVASKGIAAVIAQEKVTPQYKLDKAAKITPEQWNALSSDEKSIIRGELAKIQTEGFGPQQKKATELLDKLPAAGVKPEQKSALPPAPHVYDDSYSNAANWAVHNAVTSAAVQHQIPVWAAMTADDWKNLKPADHKKITEAVASAWKHNPQDRHKIAAAMLNSAEPGTEMHADFTKKAANKYTPTMATAVALHNATSLGKTNSVKEGLTYDLSKSLTKAEFEKLTPGEQATVKKHLTKQAESSPHKSHQEAAKAKLAELSGAPTSPMPGPKVAEEPTAGPGSLQQANVIKNVTEAIHGPQTVTTVHDVAKKVDVMKKSTGKIEDHPAFGAIVGKLASAAQKKAYAQKQADIPGVDVYYNQIAEHIKEGKTGLPKVVQDVVDNHKPGAISTNSTILKKTNNEVATAAKEAKAAEPQAPAKPKLGGLPNTASPLGTQKLLKTHGSLDITFAKGTYYEKHFADVGLPGKGDHQHYLITEGKGAWYVTDKDGKKLQFLTKSGGVHLSPATGNPAATKIENAAESAPKTDELPKHVQHAAAIANHQVPGSGLSTNHLAAYSKLTPAEFQSLPEATQGKIIQELEKGQTKFLDPKKITAAKKLIQDFKGAGGAPKPAAPADVNFHTHLNDHAVTDAQAKKAIQDQPVAAHAKVAKDLANLETADQPDVVAHDIAAKQYAKDLLTSFTKGEPLDALKDPAVQQAAQEVMDAATELKKTQFVGQAKKNAYNKITMLEKGSNLTAIQKASLGEYKKYLLAHPVNTEPEHIAKLQMSVLDATDKLKDALKDAKTPKPDEMSPAQLDSKIGELLGSEAVTPKVNLTMAELKEAHTVGKDLAGLSAAKYSQATLEHPEVAAKLKAVEQIAAQFAATAENKKKLQAHLNQYHYKALSEHDAGVGHFNAPQIAAIKAHAEKIKKDHAYLDLVAKEQHDKLTAARKEFDAAAEKVQSTPFVPMPTVLSDYDEATIADAFGNNWAKQASKATVYGLKTYSQKSEMKAHPEYAGFTQDLGNLQTAVKKLALAHAREHTAELNVPFSPETGFKINGPEKEAWLLAAKERMQAEQDYNQLYKTAQAKLDKIRTDVGLKKRALPKIDSPALKAAAAESAFYKTAGYGGPNYGKHAKAKSYLVAKVGPKLGVVHQSAAEKKAEKAAADAAKPTPGAKKLEPVTLGGADSSIAGIPADVKKQLTADFKGMPSGKYLADPASDIFDNLVVLAAAHGKNLPGGMSVDQVLKTIDETHAKNLGVANSGMLHKKITDWLGTAEGKAYAETHSTPNAKKVKQLTGEVELPPGVELKPGEKVQPLAGPGPHDESIPTSAFKAHTSAEAQAEQDAYKKAQGIVWTSAQKKAMTAYTGNGHSAYTGINNWLRGKTGYDSVVKQYAIDIQSAMMPLREHTLLKRGTGFSGLPFNASTAMDWKGKTFEDKGFTSSSVAGSGGHFSGQPLQLIIEAPKGTPAVFVNGISQYKNSENEMLLAAGTKFKVIDVSKTTGGHVVMRVRIVGDM